ncbi:hypothetical protein SEA_OTTAWA_29 [Arthrobacter phage Ottawa]|nr:hypothetical protein SEA_KHARCHO_29 [Arthrobacter phage Kharcho]WIC89261.1 hypothetical protein SEA_OTTAWA_29 [Arthrobacter phage Ottawa]
MEYTTHHPLTVGRASTVHVLNVEMDKWLIEIGRMAEGRTTAEAICGQRSPSYNSNHAHRRSEVAIPVDCKNCREILKRRAERAAAKAAGTLQEAPAALAATDSPRAKKEARLASLKVRLEAAIARREARGETEKNKTEETLAAKIEGVENWLRTH